MLPVTGLLLAWRLRARLTTTVVAAGEEAFLVEVAVLGEIVRSAAAINNSTSFGFRNPVVATTEYF